MKSHNPIFCAMIATVLLAFLWAPLAAVAQDAYEYDNVFSVASQISNGGVQNRTIHVVGDEDCATFTIGSTGAQNVHIVSSFATQLWLYRYIGSGSVDQLAYDEPNGPGDDSVIEIASLASGTYFIKIQDYGNDGVLAGYQLLAQWDEIAAIAADAYEPDNTAATAKPIASGVAQNRSIHVAGDPDLAKFTVGGAGARNVRVVSSFDTQLWLIGGGVVLGYDDANGPGDDSVIEVAFLPAGTYYIKVKEYGNDGTMAAYQLGAQWEVVAALAADAYELDNSMAAAKTIRNGQVQRRSIHRAANRDFAKFTIGGRGARNLLIQTSGPAGDTQMWLYNSAGTRLKFDEDSGPARFSRITAPLIAAGTYTIRVQEKGNDGTIPLYALKALWTPR